jgi:hypothetical protein
MKHRKSSASLRKCKLLSKICPKQLAAVAAAVAAVAVREPTFQSYLNSAMLALEHESGTANSGIPLQGVLHKCSAMLALGTVFRGTCQ